MSVLKKITFWANEKDKQGFYKKKYISRICHLENFIWNLNRYQVRDVACKSVGYRVISDSWKLVFNFSFYKHIVHTLYYIIFLGTKEQEENSRRKSDSNNTHFSLRIVDLRGRRESTKDHVNSATAAASEDRTYKYTSKVFVLGVYAVTSTTWPITVLHVAVICQTRNW